MTKPYLGIWLDHREAYLVWADGDGETEVQHTEIESPKRGKETGRTISGRMGVYGGLPPHANPDEKLHQLARQLYEKLCRAVRTAEDVYIFGPGQAKKELLKALRDQKGFGGRVRELESAQKMPESQIVARVREVFELPYPRAQRSA
jgi:hypothetical protein